jgi:hypothetical protein
MIGVGKRRLGGWRFNGFIVAGASDKRTREQSPPPKPYHKFLVAEARQLGIELGPMPQLFAFNERWEWHVEQRIAHKLMIDKFTKRKPGQRGPGKHLGSREKGGGNSTPEKQLKRQRDNYWRNKLVGLLQAPKKK